MVSFMRWWTSPVSLFCAVALAACAHAPGQITVQQASISGSNLSLHLQWQPNDDVLNALDHGIALNFVVRVRAQRAAALGIYRTVATRRRHLQLRYFPLSRRYQMKDLDRGQTRSFAVRAAALAAFEDLRLPLPGWQPAAAARYQVAVDFDRDALPGALRLPAMLRMAWHISSGTYTWHATGA